MEPNRLLITCSQPPPKQARLRHFSSASQSAKPKPNAASVVAVVRAGGMMKITSLYSNSLPAVRHIVCPVSSSRKVARPALALTAARKLTDLNRPRRPNRFWFMPAAIPPRGRRHPRERAQRRPALSADHRPIVRPPPRTSQNRGSSFPVKGRAGLSLGAAQGFVSAAQSAVRSTAPLSAARKVLRGNCLGFSLSEGKWCPGWGSNPQTLRW